jgi:hypothetical protein
MRTLTSLALLLCVAAQAGALEVLATRRLDDADRTNIMVLVRNEAAAPVTITDLRLGGVPIAEHMRFTMKRPKLGERVDWFDIRPRTIAPGAAGVIVIGSVVRELIEPVMKLEALTAEKAFDLSSGAPEPDELKITAAGFDGELKRLTVMVRNDGVEKRVVTGWRVNGNVIGVRELEFVAVEGRVSVRVDAVDAATVLMMCPTRVIADELRGKLGEKRELKHALSGVAETPVVHSAEPTQQQPEWRVRDRHFRAALTMDGPVRTPWLRAELPLDQVGVAAGSFFDAESVSVPGAGEVLVDCDEPVFGAWTKEAAWALGVSGGAMRDDSAEVRVDGRGMRCVSSYGKADGKYGWLRLTKPLDVRYDTIEMRLAISGRAIAMIEYTAEENGNAVKKSVSLGEAVTGGAWPEVTVTQMPDGLPLVRANWQALLRRSGLPMPKAGTTAMLRFQLFASTVQVSDVRQTRSRPVVYMSVVTGQKPPTFMYWDYQATRPERASGAGDVTGPEHVAAMRTGGVEVPGVAAEVRPKGVSVVTAARMRQVAAVWREADGRLAGEEQLSSGDGMHWTGQRFGAAFEVWATDGVSQVIRARGDEGHLRTMLRRSPPTPVFTVKGQVESLDCDGPGNWAVVGAAEVTCVNFAGAVIWSAAVGENVRQPEHFGGGRNVQQVQITRDGQRSLARTFRYDDKQKAYVDSVVHVFDRKGQVITQLPCAWEDDARFDEAGAVELTRLVDGKRVRLRIDPVQGQSATSPITPEPKRDLPPYTLHKLPLKDGRLIVATTQGLVQLLDGAGKVVWSTERPSRIDDARLLAGGRGVVIAWKRYTDRVSWVCEPTVEVLDLAGGKSRWSNAAGAVDDHGHYGTPLRLATSADGRRVWLGDQAGRVYCFEPEIGPSVVP